MLLNVLAFTVRLPDPAKIAPPSWTDVFPLKVLPATVAFVTTYSTRAASEGCYPVVGKRAIR